MKGAGTEANAPVRLMESQIAQASGVLARAFQGYPMFTLIFPDDVDRARSLPILMDALIRYSLIYGEVSTTPAVNAVACWLGPGNEKVTFWRMLGTGFELPQALLQFSGEAQQRTLDIVNYMDLVHEREIARAHCRRPPWYLWLLGADPAFQGQGIAGKLIQPLLARCDEVGTPCYLETAAEGNVALYRKHGFDVVSAEVVPNHGLQFWAMLREPR